MTTVETKPDRCEERPDAGAAGPACSAPPVLTARQLADERFERATRGIRLRPIAGPGPALAVTARRAA